MGLRCFRNFLRCLNSRSIFFNLFLIAILLFTILVFLTRSYAPQRIRSITTLIYRSDRPKIHYVAAKERFPIEPLKELKKPGSRTAKQIRDLFRIETSTQEKKRVNGFPYPKLNSNGNFIPMRRIVHLDLTGAAYKPDFFVDLFRLFKSLEVTGILLEWDDMFPHALRLSSAINANAYSKDEVWKILESANSYGIEVIPLIQTFGHLEWILKLEEFAHLRDSADHPQVLCVGSEEAWSLLKEMLDEVMDMHAQFGMNYFHMGADEVFQLGNCNESLKEMQKHGSRERLMAWHIARTAKYIKSKHQVSVLAWHDMLVQATVRDLHTFEVTGLVEPVLWSYAEDLEQYLSPYIWSFLRPFRKVWAASAFKGADGPMRYHSNPVHYIRNNEAWVNQLDANYNDFQFVQGIIISGWSRYDHLAVLCELLPVAIPSLAMSLETVVEGKKLSEYPRSVSVLKCDAPKQPGFVYGCEFPGRKIYELVNELHQYSEQLKHYVMFDFEFNGWLSDVAAKYLVSSPMYVDKIAKFIEFYIASFERIERDLKVEMASIYFNDTINEFIFTYLSRDLNFLRERHRIAVKIMNRKYFPKRPFLAEE